MVSGMWKRVGISIRYFRYLFQASGPHAIHSPFVFELMQQVLRDKSGYDPWLPIENLRRSLRADPRSIAVRDFGAGPLGGKGSPQRISKIARIAAKPSKYGKLLFRIARHFKPDSILELGTSLGLSTAYLSASCPDARVITLEGSPETARIAGENLKSLGLQKVQVVVGEFGETLPEILSSLDRLGLVFLDGNHKKEPTLQYFHWCLSKATPYSIFILDDIHWSREMEEAWKEVTGHDSVTLSIDLFFLGLVFFRKEFRSKEHFILRV